MAVFDEADDLALVFDGNPEIPWHKNPLKS